MTLPELLKLIEEAWPEKYERGLILHIHRNALTLADGSQVHLRVLVQRLPPSRGWTDACGGPAPTD